ncbi:aminoglycoside phosphotransferase (APT) family kinase protein [Rubricella aquisinus]|uniref:Aminoglycoside phosphotransferase (APT) family kinase protein n=1 Tax=Rubricella aquisinus TaxID=2028108 RepID=A0A840WZ80_9RHOB|nr:phosphotransferase family protein [Rubricella aquisinus]MBB5514966.1 aminoglycoside phosphotransferase (APT) family kinase protein [Rubricella aquisinus]
MAALDLEKVENYLTAHIPGFKGPLRAEKTATGQSNPTFILHAASGTYVLRRKPEGNLLKSAHAVDREFRVISALAATDVPVPKALHLCEDDGVIGSMFYVMSHVAGRNWVDPRTQDLDADARGQVFDSMNETLVRLHAVDVAAVGLSDYGKPGNYFARQVGRWTSQYRASETETIPDMDALIAWLEANMPADDGRVSLVHGDWRIDNLLFDGQGRVNAVLDWELSTLGHPFADLGYQIMQWQMPPGKTGRGLAGVDRASLGIPSDAAYIESYARRAGLSDVPDLTYAIAFSFFRMAAILQGVKKRALDGNASDPQGGLALGAYVPMFAAAALDRVVRG